MKEMKDFNIQRNENILRFIKTILGVAHLSYSLNLENPLYLKCLKILSLSLNFPIPRFERVCIQISKEASNQRKILISLSTHH